MYIISNFPSSLKEIRSLLSEKKGGEEFPQIEDNSRTTQVILKKIAHAQLHV